MTANPILLQKNIAVLLSALQNSRGFHWMQRCNSFIIPKFIVWSGMEYLTCTV